MPKWFGSSAGVIFIATGSAKILSSCGHMKVLAMTDPVFGMQYRHLILGTGLLELTIGPLCLLASAQRWPTLFVAWLSTGFLFYRFSLWLLDWNRPCACLGNLTDALHISPQLADNIMKVVLAYLLIGSYGLLFWEWRKQKRKSENRESGNEVAGVERVS